MVFSRDITRTYPSGPDGFSVYNPTGQVFTLPMPLNSERLIDTVGNKNAPNPLSITRKKYKVPGTVTGGVKGIDVYSFDRNPFTNQGFSDTALALSAPPTAAAAMTQMMASTNPSRADVSVPNFIFELGELPQLLHLNGKAHHKSKPRSSAVDYNFGWDLLFKDISRLVDYTSLVDKRVKELNALYSKRGLRTSRTVDTVTVTQVNAPTTFNSFVASVGGFVTQTTSRRTWASCQWRPDNPIDIPDAADLVRKARQVVHGWDFSGGGIASTIWEAIPWSWLSDYWLNVGDYFKSQRNAVGAHATMGCVMTHVRNEQYQTVTNVTARFQATAGSYTFETKSRVLATAGLSASWPFLSAKQLVTLLSIVQSVTSR
jgi:hypothetical protein